MRRDASPARREEGAGLGPVTDEGRSRAQQIDAMATEMIGYTSRPYHKDHVRKLLKQLGWSPQIPIQRAVQRDEAAIHAWRTDSTPATAAYYIAAMAKPLGALQSRHKTATEHPFHKVAQRTGRMGDECLPSNLPSWARRVTDWHLIRAEELQVLRAILQMTIAAPKRDCRAGEHVIMYRCWWQFPKISCSNLRSIVA